MSVYLQFWAVKSELIHTADGSHTIYVPELNEHYHSVNGAVTESKHVYCNNGFSYHPAENPVVFEAGFGTGLNCLVTALQAELTARPVYYITLEKYPLAERFVEKLNYGNLFNEKGMELFRKIHESSWEVPVQITPYFMLLKIKDDLTRTGWRLPQMVDVIYFDAFGPDKQPEMWTAEIFTRIYAYTSPGGVIVTYSAKGEVKRRLQQAGFQTEKLPGPPGKKEMLRGIK